MFLASDVKMPSYLRLLTADILFILGCFCLLNAIRGLPDNPYNLAQTQGVSAAVIYVAILLGIGAVAVLLSGMGMLTLKGLSASSFALKMTVFVLSNSLMVLTSLLGIAIIAGYVLNTFFSALGAVLFMLVILLVVTSVPRRTRQ